MESASDAADNYRSTRMPSARCAIRLRIVCQQGAVGPQRTQLVGWPAGASERVVEHHLRAALQLDPQDDVLLLPHGFAQASRAPLGLDDLLAMTADEPLEVVHVHRSRLRLERLAPVYQQPMAFAKSRLRLPQAHSANGVGLEAIMEDLSFLDMQTTSLAVERTLLGTIRFIVSVISASAKAMHDVADVKDRRNVLRVLAPCLVVALWALFAIDVLCWVSYFPIIGASRREQIRRYFSFTGENQQAASQTRCTCEILIAAASLAYLLFMVIFEISSAP